MTSPIAAVRALPRFAYLSPAEAREVVLAVLGAVDVEVMARAIVRSAAGGSKPEAREAFIERHWRNHIKNARAAIDALVAEVQEETTHTPPQRP